MYYFAYGSNINQIQMSIRMGAHLSQMVGWGYWKDHQLVFRGTERLGHYYTCIHDLSGTHQVPMLCYKIDEEGEKLMDKCEGIDGGFYHKEIIEIGINTPMGTYRKVRGITYVMNDCVESAPAEKGMPDVKYVARVLMGYINNEMPPIYIEQSLCEAGSELIARKVWESALELVQGAPLDLIDTQALIGAQRII